MSHVDDFILAGTREFLREITQKIQEKLDIFKLEDNVFRFTGIDLFKEDRIVISMEEYAKSLEKLEIIKGSSEEELTETELRIYKKYIGTCMVNLNWIVSPPNYLPARRIVMSYYLSQLLNQYILI